jgi:hypothetical protein
MEIVITIDKKTLQTSINMEGYEGASCKMDYQDILNALRPSVIDKEVNKYEEQGAEIRVHL